MAIIEWNQRYSVGIEELDEQHSRLFSIFYTLLEVGDISLKSKEVADALADLSAYTYEHFTVEEKYMAECGYPDLESHIRIHDAFRKKIGVLCSDKSEKQAKNLTEILSKLYEWLVTHVCSCDQQYVPYVTGQQLSLSDP